MATMYQWFGTSLCAGAGATGSVGGTTNPTETAAETAQRRRKAREQAARSKSGLWGPTHSMDSEDESHSEQPVPVHSTRSWFSGVGGGASCGVEGGSSGFEGRTRSGAGLSNDVQVTKQHSGATVSPTNSQGTHSTKSSSSAEPSPLPQSPQQPEEMDQVQAEPFLDRMWSNLQCQGYGTSPEKVSDGKKSQKAGGPKKFLDYMDDVCSPCQPRNLDGEFEENDISLGITKMKPPTTKENAPKATTEKQNAAAKEKSCDDSAATPADRRRQRHLEKQQRQATQQPAQTQAKSKKDEVVPRKSKRQPKVPLESLTLVKEDAIQLERSISELTMRSSYGQAHAKLAENRRMAYYAVGRHHRQSGRGGNRRCYFTGKLILGGAPFYAGSVQQGLRTLVVFCLPSSIGLPKDTGGSSRHLTRDSSVLQSLGDSIHGRTTRSRASDNASHGFGVNASPKPAMLTRKGSKVSRLSSLDDMSLSVEEELDPNWGLDKDYLLSVLPEPKQNILNEMSKRFPAQFETLPLQVRGPHCWKLYVKFCFFSGLPIAEGEMHYKVRNEIANEYGEEVILSHEVMEAVNGDSAEILRLPNLKTFRYLRKHYSQQSGKLPDAVFNRSAWEMVRPEV